MKRTPLRSRSKKRAKFMREERAPMVSRLAEQYERGMLCQVCIILKCADIPTSCGPVTGMHERRKRSSGGSLQNAFNLLSACSWGNEFIENEPELVRKRTGTKLVVREGDPEWDELSKRNDRWA